MVELPLITESQSEPFWLQEHQAAEFVYPGPPDSRLELKISNQLLEPFLRPGETAWRWRWNPGPAVGQHQIELAIINPDSTTRYTWQVRVVPRKIDQDRYEVLMDDLQRIAYGLAVTLGGMGAEGAMLTREAPWRRNPFEEYYALLEDRLIPFERAVRRIAARPREQLRRTTEQVPLGQAHAPEFSTLARADLFEQAPPGVADQLQQAIQPGGGWLPGQVPVAHSVVSTNIYEHQLLAQLLSMLQQRARIIGRLAEQAITRFAGYESGIRLARATEIMAGCNQAIRLFRELRDLPFLANVTPLAAFRGPTSLLQRDPAYREVYRMWQALRSEIVIAFDSPLFTIPINDLPKLYESWCTLRITAALIAIGGVIRTQHIVERPTGSNDELELRIALAERTPLLVMEHGERTFTLRYQPRYRPETHASGILGSLDRHTRIPDMAIEIYEKDRASRVLVLDAKYQLDLDGRHVPQDALADAYAYLGAIGIGKTQATIGAFILFPGTGKPEQYSSGVGALPLLPGSADTLETLLAEWLRVRA